MIIGSKGSFLDTVKRFKVSYQYDYNTLYFNNLEDAKGQASKTLPRQVQTDFHAYHQYEQDNEVKVIDLIEGKILFREIKNKSMKTIQLEREKEFIEAYKSGEKC